MHEQLIKVEIFGAINKYLIKDHSTPPLYSINLATGYISKTLDIGKNTYERDEYNLLGTKYIACFMAWYRPCKILFDSLTPKDKEYILQGGLMYDTLKGALILQLVDDPVTIDMGAKIDLQNTYQIKKTR